MHGDIPDPAQSPVFPSDAVFLVGVVVGSRFHIFFFLNDVGQIIGVNKLIPSERPLTKSSAV
jgi:hypothetical protein